MREVSTTQLTIETKTHVGNSYSALDLQADVASLTASSFFRGGVRVNQAYIVELYRDANFG